MPVSAKQKLVIKNLLQIQFHEFRNKGLTAQDFVVWLFISAKDPKRRNEFEKIFLRKFNETYREDKKSAGGQKDDSGALDAYITVTPKNADELMRSGVYKAGDQVLEDDLKYISDRVKRNLSSGYKITKADEVTLGDLRPNLSAEEVYYLCISTLYIIAGEVINANNLMQVKKAFNQNSVIMKLDKGRQYFLGTVLQVSIRTEIQKGVMEWVSIGKLEPKKRKDVINFIKEYDGTNFNIIDYEEYNLLANLINLGEVEIIKCLVEESQRRNLNLDFNLIVGEDQMTPLILAIDMAVVFNSQEVIKVLIDSKKCNLNIVDGKGNVPIVFAVRRSREEIVDRMIERGADVNLRDGTQRALNYAINNNHIRMTVKLLGKGARFTQGSFLADTNSIALFVMAMFHDFHYYSKNFSISAEDILKIATHPVKLNPDHPIFSFIKNAQNSLNDSDTLESAFEKIGFDKKDSKEEKKENDKAKKLIEDTRVAINAFYGDYFKQLESIKEQELGKIEKIFQNILFVQKKMKDVHDAMAYTSIPNEDKIKISDLLFHHIKDQQIYNSSRIEEMVNQMQKLEKCDLNEVQKIIARDIEKNGQQINENVDDIYTLAKPESLMQEEKSMQNDQKGNEGKLGNTSWIWAVNSLTVPLSSVPTQRDELAALEKDQKETKAREIIAQEEKERELKAAKEKELQQKAEQQKKYVEAKRREEEQKEIQRKIEIQKRLEAEKMERLKKEREAKENAQREAKERELQRRRYIEAKRREEEKKSAGKRRQIKDRRQKVAQEQKSQVLEKKKQKLIPKGYSLRKPVVPGTTVRPGTKPGFPIISRRPSRNQNNQK